MAKVVTGFRGFYSAEAAWLVGIDSCDVLNSHSNGV